jgi:8-oxo-dGTP pyrophosphatase MutT (NUDIX family)
MIIFVKDKTIQILSKSEFDQNFIIDDFSHFHDCSIDHPKELILEGQIVVLNANAPIIAHIFNAFDSNKNLEKLQTIYIISDFQDQIEDSIKKRYTVVKAAGGVVVKENTVLMISRLGKWDLPKGKLDSGENSKTAAVREIYEETGVKAELVSKLCTTWHTYELKGEKCIKRTKWYTLNCLNDSKMKPQKEEGIEDLGWKNPSEQKLAMLNTYSSIRYVMKKFNQATRNSLIYGSL